MTKNISIGTSLIFFLEGDITNQKTDAIVNAANSSLMGGGGVDGAIHRKGGPVILEECKKIVSEIGRLKTGGAVITSGGNLPSRYVIHTVGPVYGGGKRDEANLLKQCYMNSLKLADDNGIKTVSFPSISTGAYRYPVTEAARIAVSTVREYLSGPTAIKEVHFVLFDEGTFETYASYA